MKLERLFKNLPFVQIKGSKAVKITGICSDSRRVCLGDLFIAKKGHQFDGNQFVKQAVENGAVAILTNFYDPFLKKTLVQVLSNRILEIEPIIVARFHQFPSKELFMVGITGTNGKTTSAYLVKHLLDHSNCPCGLISTNEYILGKTHLPATLTTPAVDVNQKLLREMCFQQCLAVAMEVSSQALDQRRADQIEFDIACFTNLTSEHLDYHKSMQNYARAKRILFESLEKSTKKKKLIVFNKDDPWQEKIVRGFHLPYFSCGIQTSADLVAKEIKISSQGTSFKVCYRNKQAIFHTQLIGVINVYNLLNAISIGIFRGIELEEMSQVFQNFNPVEGRLQKINHPNRNVFIDYAHTPDALKQALRTLHQIKKGKIITVFGCGGCRDWQKRPQMAKVAEEFSDFVIVTNDNPRSEDPEKIAREISKGFVSDQMYIVELDRKEAIRKAIQKTNAEDLVLIAGKGHEKSQIFSHKTIAFDDSKVATEILSL